MDNGLFVEYFEKNKGRTVTTVEVAREMGLRTNQALHGLVSFSKFGYVKELGTEKGRSKVKIWKILG